MLHIVIPTHDEAPIIRSTLERLIVFLRTNFSPNYTDFYDREKWDSGHPAQHLVLDNWRIIVADNGSTDATREIVREVIARDPRIELFEIPEAGKGRAVLTAWKRADRQLGTWNLELGTFIFMDADLATDLDALPQLIAAIRNGADIAVGSRYALGAHIERGIFRRCASRCNQFLIRALFGLRVADAPCGFKAVNERVVRDIVPLVCDTQWFFDTELLVRSQRAGMRIVEIPVSWKEPRCGRSFQKVLRIIIHDLRAIAVLRGELA